MHDQVGSPKDILSGLDDLGAGRDIGLVVKSAAHSCILFHQDPVIVFFHNLDACGRHGNAVFFGLDLFENPNDHCCLLSPVSITHQEALQGRDDCLFQAFQYMEASMASTGLSVSEGAMSPIVVMLKALALDTF